MQWGRRNALSALNPPPPGGRAQDFSGGFDQNTVSRGSAHSVMRTHLLPLNGFLFGTFFLIDIFEKLSRVHSRKMTSFANM